MTEPGHRFAPGDDITLGERPDSPKGTLVSLVPGAVPPIWNVKMQDGSFLSIYESALILRAQPGSQ